LSSGVGKPASRGPPDNRKPITENRSQALTKSQARP